MKAVILAAGRNVRLRSITEKPKTLLRVGKYSLLDRIALACKSMGISRVVLVVGYKADSVEEHIAENPEVYGSLSIKTIYNPEYERTNNIFSLWLARREMGEPFILFNSDVLFHEEILARLIRCDPPSALAVDDVKQLGHEEMKVVMNEGRLITDISKEIDPQEAHGEYIGIAKFFDPNVAREVTSRLEDLISSGRTDVFYEESFRLLSVEEPTLYGVSTGGLPWIEVDTPHDYERALKEVYPKIVQMGGSLG